MFTEEEKMNVMQAYNRMLNDIQKEIEKLNNGYDYISKKEVMDIVEKHKLKI